MKMATVRFPEGTILVTKQKARFYPNVGRYQCCEGQPVKVPEGTAVVVFMLHGPERLLVHTIDNPKLWACVWSEILEAPLQEQES